LAEACSAWSRCSVVTSWPTPSFAGAGLTFRWTRVCVADVLDEVATDKSWETIVEERGGAISRAAIADALRLAREALLEHVEQPLYEAGKRDPSKVTELGQYVVAHPGICQGRLTFRGTRVFVAAVLEDVADERWWESISREWHGLPEEAITEAVLLAREALLKHWKKLLLGPSGR
jgi:uncharacterized protein (DUF433 family)